MANEKTINHGFCPFWTPDSQKCLVCKGGLFIPLDDHIDIYCKTSDHPQCLQYSMYAENHRELLTPVASPVDNRREHQRHSVVHKVTLVKMVESGEIVSHLSTVAQTLDLSQGGMRLNIKKPLVDDSLIEFSFDDSFPNSLRDGTGQVQWCNKQIDESGYQAGISFQDDRLIESMGTYLGLQL